MSLAARLRAPCSRTQAAVGWRLWRDTLRLLATGVRCGLAVLTLSATAYADTVTLTAVADTTLYSENGELSDGAGSYVFVGRAGIGGERRALLRFDLTGIPAGATITNVELQLAANTPADRGAVTVNVHRVLESWGEGTSVADRGEGGGGAASQGDATWTHRSFNTQVWTTSGGSFSASASATTAVGANGAYSWQGDGLLADVRNFLASAANNNGWILVAPGAASAKRFNSRSSTLVRPQLRVVFTAPTTDQDGDGVGDGTDNCARIANADQADRDSNGIGDACDFPLDVDGNGRVDALSDGLLILRFMFGFSGNALVDGAVAADAHPASNDADELRTRLLRTNLDVDGNSRTDALSDGVLIVRFLFGFGGRSLVDGAVAPDAASDRDEAAEIESHLRTLRPSTMATDVTAPTVGLLQAPRPPPAPWASRSAVLSEPRFPRPWSAEPSPRPTSQ